MPETRHIQFDKRAEQYIASSAVVFHDSAKNGNKTIAMLPSTTFRYSEYALQSHETIKHSDF